MGISNPRHVAILRSICETFGGKPAYCVCGLKASDPIHFSRKEYNDLSKRKRLTEWRGLTVEVKE